MGVLRPSVSALVRLVWLCVTVLILFAGPVSAADLQVSQYSFVPDPVPNGGSAIFAIRRLISVQKLFLTQF